VLSRICCEQGVPGVCRFELRDEFLDQCERNRVTIAKTVTRIALKFVAQALSKWRHELFQSVLHRNSSRDIKSHPGSHSTPITTTRWLAVRSRLIPFGITPVNCFIQTRTGHITHQFKALWPLPLPSNVSLRSEIAFLRRKRNNGSGAMNQAEILFVRHKPVITSASCYDHFHFD
jgi:hypothetical protein